MNLIPIQPVKLPPEFGGLWQSVVEDFRFNLLFRGTVRKSFIASLVIVTFYMMDSATVSKYYGHACALNFIVIVHETEPQKPEIVMIPFLPNASKGWGKVMFSVCSHPGVPTLTGGRGTYPGQVQMGCTYPDQGDTYPGQVQMGGGVPSLTRGVPTLARSRWEVPTLARVGSPWPR